ncbi:carbon monoxide dehydrogenase [Intrasporangium oryzae NRRL B-24470]|uniref:Carbon monoxide dehydrogenase n=1 Tax=Intrasporangium oryzae NRRL B-24470 TaxID=1386089 RepID=W9GG07_9MICO|nr:carbon monoxide dehydrogenase subunit G [Intrasporangium oryzae]EWT02814.1 carbon monoxide dehydrogenase [Intrasporangium oryzae NRRL B-24470]
MKITGTATLAAPPQQVWDAFHDPAVLARCLPGCERLVELGPDHYAMTVTAGVAAIKGTYDGEVSLRDPQHPDSFTMKATGAGAPGTVDADVVVRLAPSSSGGTELAYDADASVGGAIGGVGQRMLAGVTKKMAGQFFTAVDSDIAGVRPAAVEGMTVEGVTVESMTIESVALEGLAGGPGTVYPGRAAAPPAGSTRLRDFALGAATGAAIALVGVVVGWAAGRG